ncbi:MAG: adenine phosphoribosyltransferase, partial [Dehalococcoidia bacterium]
VEKLGGEIVELAFVVELPDLKGRDKVKGHNIFAITEFEGD